MIGRRVRDYAERGERSSEKTSGSPSGAKKDQNGGKLPAESPDVKFTVGDQDYGTGEPADRAFDPPTDPNGPAVLVVDDDPGVRRSLARILRHAGCRPITTSDGEAAVELCVRMRPELVLLDLSMPNFNGPQVIKALRTRLGEQLPRVVWITGTVTPDNLHHLGGAVACIPKPVGVAQIREIMGKYLAGSDGDE